MNEFLSVKELKAQQTTNKLFTSLLILKKKPLRQRVMETLTYLQNWEIRQALLHAPYFLTHLCSKR